MLVRLRLSWILVPLALLLIVGLTLVVLWQVGWLRPRITEEEVRTAIVATLQREAPASFYVTGTLDLTTTATLENTKRFLPDVLDFSLGTTEAVVRLPGRAHYGFDVRHLRPQDVRLREDGTVEVTLPPLRIYAVEPDLNAMEVQTSVGWARMYRRSGRRVEQQAVRFAEDALRQQAEAHLTEAVQPRVHTAEAMEVLLRPVLQAAGVEHPTFRFQVGPELVLQPGG